jgi:hypothetical protein
MGFPNVDIFLVKKLLERFEETQRTPKFFIGDTFDDLDPGRQAEITTYITRKTFTDDLRNRGENRVAIFPHFPMFDMTFPQIGISLGQESPGDTFVGDSAGESTPFPATGTPTHWDIPKLYLGAAMYRIDIVTATKDEAIWLSRLVQRFICEEQESLAAIGAFDIGITIADLKLEQDQQPLTVFNRAVQINCKVMNRWTKRVPVGTYETGVNNGVGA